MGAEERTVCIALQPLIRNETPSTHKKPVISLKDFVITSSMNSIHRMYAELYPIQTEIYLFTGRDKICTFCDAFRDIDKLQLRHLLALGL